LYEKMKPFELLYPGSDGKVSVGTITTPETHTDGGCTLVTGFLCPSDQNYLLRVPPTPQPINYAACDGDYSYEWRNAPPADSRGAMTYRGYTGLEAISDGTSNTILFSEHIAVGNTSTRQVREALAVDAAAVPNSNNLATARADLCLLNKGTGREYKKDNSGNPLMNTGEGCGRKWTCGWTIHSHFNTIAPPNSPGCSNRSNQADAMIQPPTSNHSGGVNTAISDGSVRFISDTINTLTSGIAADAARPKKEGISDFGVWGALGTRSGGESTMTP
jgi:hypothetical protein